MVGVTRFEHATTASQTQSSTKLSYTPVVFGAEYQNRTDDRRLEICCFTIKLIPHYFIETHCCGHRVPSGVVSRNQTFPIYTVLPTMYFNKVSSYSHHMSPRLGGYPVHVLFYLDRLASLPL